MRHRRHPFRSNGAGRALGLLLAGLMAASSASGGEERPAGPPSPPCEQAVPAIYARVAPTVVSIAAASSVSQDLENPFDRGEGSGVVIDASGLIVTCAHVVLGRQFVNVTLGDGSVLNGRLVEADAVSDIALVRVAPPAGLSLQAARLGDSDRVAVGEDVLVIGNPFGLEQTLSRGIVSAVNRLVPGTSPSLAEPMIQTDAPINPGNSGGPLVDRCGEVVGIATSILPEAQGIGFAVPVNLVKRVVPSLLRDGRVARPWFCVRGELVSRALKDLFRTPLVDGFLVEAVDPGSPADRIGVRGGRLEVVVDGTSVLLGGDIVTRIDGASVDDIERLVHALDSFQVGATVHLTLFRDGDFIETDCVLAEHPLLRLDVPGRRSAAPMSGGIASPSRADGARGAGPLF